MVILIVQYSGNRSGSAFSGLLAANAFRESGWSTHVAFGFDGAIVEEFLALGHMTHVVPHQNWLRRAHPLRFVRDVLAEVRTARDMERLIDRVQPDVVYVNTAVSLSAAVAARRRGLPCIWHLRELFADVGGEMKAPPVLIPFVRRTLRTLASRIVVNSAAVAENMLGTAAGTAVIIPNAVDAVFFEDTRSTAATRQLFGLPDEGYTIGVPGTLRPMKGHPFFFEALARLAEKRTDLVVAVTGGGHADYARLLETRVRELGLAHLVHFLGYIDDMSAFYQACDVVCIPSVAEPFGRTVIEAFAAGTPVVATAVGGIQETVEDGRTGLLVPYGDVEQLAACLDRVLEDADLRACLCQQARREAEAKYQAPVYKRRLLSIVHQLTAQRAN